MVAAVAMAASDAADNRNHALRKTPGRKLRRFFVGYVKLEHTPKVFSVARRPPGAQRARGRAQKIATLRNSETQWPGGEGTIFAGAQVRYYRQRRQREAMLEPVRSFQSPAFTSALRRVLSLPDGATAQKIREVLGPDGEDAVYLVSLTWESIGILLFRRELTLNLVDDFFSGPILLSWQKLRTYSEEWRKTLNRETGSEWFHWLAERMMQREKSAPPVPAYIAHKGWREGQRK